VRAGARVSDELPDLDTEWRVQARWLAAEREWDFSRAYDHIMVGYLMEGDCRPLLDLILRQARAPGLPASRYIAAMIDGEQRARLQQAVFPYVMHIVQNQRRGRPKTQETHSCTMRSGLTLVVGLRALGEGRMPPLLFWSNLAAAIDFEAYKRDKGTDFPWRAKLVRTDGRKGRPRDPGLPLRNFTLAALVSEKRKPGAKYEDAVEQVRADIEKQGAADNWKGWIEKQTIRDAYDALTSKKRRKGSEER
jgi:hypothetical protein